MTAINFPANPSNGDTHQGFVYNSTLGVWQSAGSQTAITSFTGLSDTPSTLGTAGQIAKVNSGGTALEFADQSGVTVYANVDALPGSGNTGDLAFVTATNRLYLWNGSGWYNIALINTTPSISGVNSSYTLASDGTDTVITITATDPEGLPITYSIASDTSGNIATVTQGTGASSNVFTITPSTNDANGGTFSLTFRASDGVNIASSIAAFTLQFKVVNSNYTTALITSVGANNAVNNTFVDSSSNSRTITVGGNTTQSTFSPYRHGGYSYHWDGSGTDYFQILSPTAALDFGTGDFTVEMWIWLNDLSSGIILADTRPSETNGNQYIGAFSIGTDGNYQMHTNNVQRIVTTGAPITAGSWHHIALQRNNGTLEAYVDGSRNATASFTQSLDANRWSLFKNSFASGGVADAGGGYIKDYRVVKGTAVYSGATYDVPTEPLTAISGTSFLLFSDNIYIRDESVGTETITWTNGMYKPFSPYDYLKYNSSVNGGSIYFDGSGDYLRCDEALDNSTSAGDPLTVEMWLYFPTGMAFDSSGFTALYGMNRASDGNNHATMGIRTAGFIWHRNGSEVNTAYTHKYDTWFHFAVVYHDGTNGTTIYINGESIYTSTTAHTTAFSDCVFLLGTEADAANAGSLGNWYNGYMSDVRVTNSAVYTSNFTPPTAPLTDITNTELLIKGNNAGIIDKSQSVQTLTLNGDVKSSTAQSKYLTSSMYFDGTGDLIELNNSISNWGAADFTIETWVYPTALGTRHIFGDFNSAGQNASSTLVAKFESGYLKWWIQTTTYNSITGTTALSTNAWTHIALVRNGSTITSYVNGTSDGTFNVGTAPINTPSIVYTIGTGGDYRGDFFEGYMSDFRFTKGLARYTANFTPPTAELKG